MLRPLITCLFGIKCDGSNSLFDSTHRKPSSQIGVKMWCPSYFSTAFLNLVLSNEEGKGKCNSFDPVQYMVKESVLHFEMHGLKSSPQAAQYLRIFNFCTGVGWQISSLQENIFHFYCSLSFSLSMTRDPCKRQIIAILVHSA
ncbi:hypothetical protein SUGI_0341620 [Cryptomeria japonica]|nr:hypothetical protein SUGI_0341620 [Cryptomeria japonica]